MSIHVILSGGGGGGGGPWIIDGVGFHENPRRPGKKKRGKVLYAKNSVFAISIH